MNFGPSAFNVTTTPATSATAPTSSELWRTEPAHEPGDRQEQQFEQALRDALARKQAPLMPLHWPWQAQHQPVVGEDAEQVVEAASGVSLTATAGASLFQLPTAARRIGTSPEGELEVAAPREREASEHAEPVQVLVEPGLPPIQPAQPSEGQPVHLVDFPQVVTGTVRQMVKDNQPVTQLDFQISPPHVGPVNLQVALQNGAVNVQLVALTMQAKQALESQVGAIQTILQAHNLTPGQVKVVTAASGKSGAGSTGQRGDQSGFGLMQGGRRRSPAGQDGMSVTAT